MRFEATLHMLAQGDGDLVPTISFYYPEHTDRHYPFNDKNLGELDGFFAAMSEMTFIPDTARACKDCGHTCKSENIGGMTIMFHTYIESVCIEGPDSDGPFVWAHGDEPAFRKDFA